MPGIEEYTNVDPKIAHPLGRLRSIIRRYVTIEGVLALGLFLVTWFWLALLLDYGIFKLFAFDWALDAPKTLRTVMLVIALAGILALIVTKLVLRLTRDFSPTSLALVLEKRFPQILGDRLITAVQLSDMKKAKEYGYSTEMIAKTINDVREKVDQIPVESVFNWKRLRRQGLLLGFMTFGLVLLYGVGHVLIAKESPSQFISHFTDTSMILVERDLLLQNTPWPRRAYLELKNFPGEEIRVGRDVPSPKVRVAAYQWVWADSASPVGWRPLTWADLDKALPGQSLPTLPLQQLRDARFAVDYGPFVYGAAHPFQAPTLPLDVNDVPEDPALWPIDRIEQVFLQNEEAKAMLVQKFSTELGQIEEVVNKLNARAAEASMSRALRKLKIPDEVELRYWGPKTRVDMKLRAEPNNEFSGTLSDLKESIKFFARGENYDTPTRIITLVPPPMLTELLRDEYHPAYLYHKAPFEEASKLSDELKPYTANPNLLKGVKHLLRQQSVSLTGDRSRIDIPQGTEFVLSGKSDKPLQKVQLIPKPGKFPGIEAENTEPLPLDLPIVDGDRFRFDFTEANKMMITRPTEFEIYLLDTDNVASRRLIQIYVEEDRPPEVDVMVDVIRKVGSTYLCTPQALIPFTKESKVRDDKGLNRVEYVFSYYEIEPPALTQKRMELASWLFNGVPALNGLGDPLTKTVSLISNYNGIKPENSVVTGQVPVPAFAEEFRKRQKTFDQVKGVLDGPRPVGADLDVVTLLDYRSGEGEASYASDSNSDVKYGFDIRRVAPGLKRDSANEVQRTYQVTLNVVATDSNVDGKPGVTQNKEVFVFKLVSDAELLTEIAREEATLADKLDDAIRRLTDVDNKFRSTVSRFGGLTTPDAFLAEVTRSNELVEQIGKARDVTGELNADYARIFLEYKVNRLPENLINAASDRIIRPLDEVLTKLFPETEKDYTTVHSALSQNKTPSPEEVFKTQQSLTTLLSKLREIRSGIGEGLDNKKLISQLESVITGIRVTKTYIEEWRKQITGLIDKLNIVVPPAAVTVASGQKVTVRMLINAGVAYTGDFEIQLEASPDSDLKVPAKVKLKEEEKEFVLEVTAGLKKGNHSIRITPDVGPVKDLKVIVR
jgi:molybdopterin converting factor small subunit